MLNMLQILKDKNIHSISSLAQKLEVSERMIRQYKSELEQAGIYLKSYTGKYGGYNIDKWYIVAFCELRNEIRLFKLDDITQYEVLTEKYIEKNTIKK